MKEFINRLYTAAMLVAISAAAIWGAAHCIALLSAINGVSARIHYIVLAILVIGGAAGDTILARRRKKRAEILTTKIMADAIQEQRDKLARINADTWSGNQTRRRAICKVTLLALEERQARILKGGKTE